MYFVHVIRFSIVGDQDDGEFNLMISDVDNTDVGTYHCIVSDGGPGNSAISSSGATLTVIGKLITTESGR